MAETSATAAQSCLSDPNFAVVCFYLQKFGPHLGLPELNLQQLRSAIDERKLGGGILRDLHLSLLRKLGRKSVSGGRWEKCVEQFALSCCCVDAWYLSQHGYAELGHADKVSILKNLLEAQFDSNTKFKEKLNEIPADELRQQPIGYDSEGQAYWFLVDSEMNLSLFRGELEDTDGETWRVVSRERNGLAEFIEGLKKTTAFSLPAADAKPVPPLVDNVCQDEAVARSGSPAATAAAAGGFPRLTAEIKIEPEKDSSQTGRTEEPPPVSAADPCPDAGDGADDAESSSATAAEEEEERSRHSSQARQEARGAVGLNGYAAGSIAAVKKEEDGPLLVSECIADSAAMNEDACGAASDCSSDNVPLSQVRKSCRLMSRARAAIAEVKRRRDRDKRKVTKKAQKRIVKPVAKVARQRRRRQRPNSKKPAGRRPRKSASSDDDETKESDGAQSDCAIDDGDDDDDEDPLLLESEDSSDADYVPHGRNAQRAARRKAAAGSAAVTSAECAATINDDTPCTRCGEYTHPDLILLCDRCNAGYHTGCLRPPLFVIPDGDWFCPHCQHNMLVEKLEAALSDYDAKLKVKLRIVKRQERMANSGISVQNIIVSHAERPKRERAHKRVRDEDFDYDVDEEPEERPSRPAAVGSAVKRSCRTRNKVSYRYEEYDELIKSAIADSCDPQSNGMADGRRADADEGDCDTRKTVGRRGGGKDIATIMHAEQTSQCNPTPPPAPVSRGKDMSTILGAASDVESGTDESDGDENGGKPARRPSQLPKKKRNKKARRLTGLDDSASDYDDDDGDEYKATDDDDYEEEEDELDADSLDDDACSGSSPGSWCESRNRRSLRPERRATRNQPARATKATARRYTAGLEESGSDEETASGRRRRSGRASRPEARRVQIADSDDDAESEAGAAPRRRQQKASKEDRDYSDGSESAEESPCSEEGDEDDYVPSRSRMVNKWNKRAVPAVHARSAAQKKRRRAIVDSENEASASECKDDEIGSDRSPSAGSDRSPSAGSDRSPERGKSRSASDDGGIDDDAEASPDDVVEAAAAGQVSASADGEEQPGGGAPLTRSTHHSSMSHTDENSSSSSSRSPANADSDKRSRLLKNAIGADVTSTASPTIPVIPVQRSASDRDSPSIAKAVAKALSGSRVVAPGTAVAADQTAELAAARSPGSRSDVAPVSRVPLPSDQQQLPSLGHGYLDRPRSRDASASPVASGWSGGQRASLEEPVSGGSRLISSPLAYTSSPVVGAFGGGPAGAYSTIQQPLPSSQQPEHHAYTAPAGGTAGSRSSVPHGQRLHAQSTYYGSLPSPYGGYGPIALQSSAVLPDYAAAAAAMAGSVGVRGSAAPQQQQQFPPYAQSYYPGLQQQQQSPLVGDCLPPYGCGGGSSVPMGGYGAMYVVPRHQQQLRGGYAPIALDAGAAVAAAVRDANAEQATGAAAAAAAAAPPPHSAMSASSHEQLSNSHHASFSIASILQPSQQQQQQKATAAAAAADENEDELSNILDIASIVTGAPVGDERVHKS